MLACAPVYRFHVSRKARERYSFAAELFSTTGNVVFLDLHAVRLFTHKMNEVRAAGTARGTGGAADGAGTGGVGQAAPANVALRAGEMNAMGLIDEILHFVAGLYRKRIDPLVFTKALAFLEERIGGEIVDATLERFAEEFPSPAPDRGDAASSTSREVVLEEMLLLALANANPAFEPFRELFDDAQLRVATSYERLVEGLGEFFRSHPPFGPDDEDLVSMLRAPVKAAPASLSGQLAYIRTRWGSLLGDLLLRLLTGLDLIGEEEKMRFATFGPGPVVAHEYMGQTAEGEAFSPDIDWMPRTVMIAKNALVWLEQLSRSAGREVRRLDQVPDEELDRLARSGFTALWLIGVWERSAASREIKRRMGNPEAEASAYSLFDYTVAGDLGGEPALQDLKRRAWERGIRLASDMVPNHTGIDSAWMRDRPDRFLRWPHPYPPYPSYSFNGPNLSTQPGVGIWIEDHYWNRSDAAVVFKRVDFQTGDARYLYHGNDGTHMPWNDTAQLDFLNPETREAVIQAILRVARMFPIIRFDAAMTLTKKHFQRLWYPEPGSGGDIPSRAGNGLARHDFNRAMPSEFWREVVDRVAREAPDTLLLAEAFWLLEGFFVRTLGMHRVYNSAFMNMLKMEDNSGYRKTIRNTLEFDPEVLKRFVNFMSNPDEETAIAQFGDGDKYFGVCTLMATMPGLPMFAHGQIDGFWEKYGMEFRRSYWNEQPNGTLVSRHEREIFPLLKRRHLFSGVEHFLLYDFFSSEFFSSEGSVNEDVFAFSNRRGEERALVLYNNRFAETRGWVRASAAFAVKTDSGKVLAQRSLAEGIGLPNDGGAYVVFHDHVSGLQYVRGCAEIHDKGLYAELGAYGRQVFLDFSVIYDDWRGLWRQLNAELSGRGVASVDHALRELDLRPVRDPFRAILNIDEEEKTTLAEATRAYEGFLTAAGQRAPGAIDENAAAEDFASRLPTVLQAMESAASGNASPAFLWAWAILRPLCGPGKGGGEPAAASWVVEWMLAPIIRDFLARTGWEARSAEVAPGVLAALLRARGIRGDAAAREAAESPRRWPELFQTPEVQGFLRVNTFEGVRWFGKEELELLLQCLDAVSRAAGTRAKAKHAAAGGTKGAAGSRPHRGTRGAAGVQAALLTAAERSGYRWDEFLNSLSGIRRGSSV